MVGEGTRVRAGDALAVPSPWFADGRITAIATRDEVVGLQIAHPDRAPIAVAFAADVEVATFATTPAVARAGSTEMYGPTRGAGTYADGLVPDPAPASDPAYVELRAHAPGHHAGTLTIRTTPPRTIPIDLEIVDVTLPTPASAPMVWAYEDPREFGWAGAAEPRAAERACQATFRGYGVVLSPELAIEQYDDRAAAYAGLGYLAVDVGDDPQTIGPRVAAWIAKTRGTGTIPFAIPIDEPRDHAARLRVRALADAARAAGSGPSTFWFAVTDEPRPEYGDAIDLYLRGAHATGDRYRRWAYNGGLPGAGALVADADTPGPRTWGAIAYRYAIDVWYVWDALYWHDRHNRKRRHEPLPGPMVDAARDARTFDDGEDSGNLDGVLALPGAGATCQPTLRLAAIRRGIYDRRLLERAARCDRARVAAIAAALIPRACADAREGDPPAWSTDEAAWERTRRELIAIARTCP